MILQPTACTNYYPWFVVVGCTMHRLATIKEGILPTTVLTLHLQNNPLQPYP